MIRVIIGKHSPTPVSAVAPKLKKLQGAADVPLAKEGILLAEKTGEALRNVKFDICFTSPLSRAKQTAEYVLGKRDVPIIPDKRIQEIDFGVLEGDQVRDAASYVRLPVLPGSGSDPRRILYSLRPCHSSCSCRPDVFENSFLQNHSSFRNHYIKS